ncbi:MAG: hypothetical protein IPK22_03255 [Verrucomicrobiaceae bacterium]|nr:hypothetical protein [Verrucomicrobiaceae bacterium]
MTSSNSLPLCSGLRDRASAWLKSLGVAALLGSPVMAVEFEMPRSFFVDLSTRPDELSLAAFDLSVLHAQAEADLEPGHMAGNRFLAMLNVAELRTKSFQEKLAAKQSVTLTAGGDKDQLVVADPSQAGWLGWAVAGAADPAAKKGFDGFVLSLGQQPASKAWRVAVLELAQVLKKRFQDKQILLDARIGIGGEAAGIADGVLALGVHTQSGKNGAAELGALNSAREISAVLRHARAAGMRVLGVEFAAPHDHEAIREAAGRLHTMGVMPFITTPSLDGVNLGPVEEISRRVLVLHGWDASLTGEPAPAADTTLAARCLHAPLEWLGFRLEFLAMTKDAKLPDAAGFRGVILDGSLLLDVDQQKQLAAWVRDEAKAKNIPVLLTSMPWRDEDVLADVRETLSLGGTGKAAPKLVKTGVARMDSTALRSGVKATARAMGFLDLEAPADAKVVLAVRGQDTLGTEHRFDQVFHCSWGSAWMEPAALSAGPQADLFAFTAEWLAKGGVTPAPDTTTLDGRRVFFNTFSAEGFTTPSSLPGFRLCAEVVRERILSRYFLPFTVAVCEADLRGWRPGQNPEDAPHFEQLARAIFDMPHVAAASYSFSQPTQWTQEDKINGPLNEHAKTNRFDMEREVAGSMSYIHRALLPAGKSISLMLWPSTGAPGSDALDFCARIGVQSLTPAPSRSAGDSAVIALPSANEVSANSWMHGDNVEVFATAATRADARPTLEQQLATLQAEAKNPRRISPVALSASFRDVRDDKGLADLSKALDWCAAEPLHAITAASYAASVRDAARTRVLKLAERHWIVLNEGRARTLRLPASAGVPDMARCEGISGYTVSNGQLYIHAMGEQRSEIVLTEKAPAVPHLHLEECSGKIEFLELTSRRATFQVYDWRQVEVVIGGFEPNGLCAYTENGRPYSANADSKGIVRLDISRQATVQLQSLPPAPATAAN